MLVAVLSDIHGNRHALEAVLDDVRARGAGELWCLGDVVGYGADPAACIALIREHAAVCLAGFVLLLAWTGCLWRSWASC